MPSDPEFEIIPLDQVPREGPAPDAERPVLLVVDDERLIADTLSVILAKSGYSVLTAYDGRTALELARETPPTLLLSDVMMPGMTGIDLAIAIRQSAPSCKVLLFSGYAATVDMLTEVRDAGHNFSVLSKPIHPSDLLKSLSEMIDAPNHFPQSSRSGAELSIHSPGAKRPAPTGGASRSTGSMTAPASWLRRVSSSVRSK
jgi:CheY-like chemotaxis protein